MTNIQEIKQPKPNVTTKRKINRPNVGVVSVPKISFSPLEDSLEIKKLENPKVTYKLKTKNEKESNKAFFASLAIIILGLISFFINKKKIKK